jgi:hypothetical protein
MKIGAFLEKQAEKIPGLGYVATALSLVTAIVLRTSSEHMQVWLIALVWLYAVFFYLLGAALDPVFYDPWFSLYPADERRLKRAWYNFMRIIPWFYNKRLNEKRMEAAIKLRKAVLEAAQRAEKEAERAAETAKCSADELASALDELQGIKKKQGEPEKWDIEAERKQSGIYRTVNLLFQKSDSWDAHVKPWLEASKAARAFVIPLSLIGTCDIVKSIWFPHMATSHMATSPLKPFMGWLLAFPTACGSLLVYLWWRVVHAIHLYELVSKHDVFMFNSQSTEVGAVTQKRTLISTGIAVFRWEKLPLFEKDDDSKKNLWSKIVLVILGLGLAGIAIASIWWAITA